MKYLVVAVLGLFGGAALAGAMLYFNPFSLGSAAPSSSGRVLQYTLPDDVLELALGADARLLGVDGGADALWEETIDRSAVMGLTLNDANRQPVAIASRLTSVSPQTDLVLRGVLLSDFWLVTIPGEGTLFVHTDSNAWPFLKETLVPVWYLDRPWHGPAQYWPTVGPGTDDAGVVVGVAGTFSGGDGSAVESYELTALDRANGSALARGALHVDLPGPQVAVQQ